MYSALNKDKCFQKLSPQTITDIDFQEVFSFIDRTTSCVGQQYLYDKFCKPTNDLVALQTLQKQVDFFKKEAEKRERAQLLLSILSNDSAYSIATLLRDKLAEKPRWFYWLYLNLFVLICLLLLSIKFPVLLLWSFIPIGINIFVSLWNKANANNFSQSMPQLNVLIKAAEMLQQQGFPVDDKKVSESLSALQAFRKKIRFIVFERGTIMDDISQIVFALREIIKSIFAYETFIFFSLLKDLEFKKFEIQTLFKYVGEIDASTSVASLQSGTKRFCTPKFFPEQKEIFAKNIYHPLIENAVGNDLHLLEKSILITGSNMSGKTSFLRTVALNAVCAQTIYTCFADEFVLPFVKIFSSIRIDDDLLQGKSYYLEEVDVVKKLVDASDEGSQCLFVLDEVFKGTNTAERVALGKSVLSYLNRKNSMVLVATHDLELADLLASEYELYHFSETIEDDELHFDHLLKKGKLATTNAIRLIEIAEFPNQITNEAKDLKQRFQNK
ncbi:hypothetical protein A9P82_00320 [Arachidicoccus ginsenosidimutans]|uniref:MutS-related protein n=1 Tax=Arachidicoccus sp. BS20 TaxID=1850526 RepID=UPI0007F11046|nr:hypothetical protein [Arachidicoccus sp. BS20]ANI87901.1 hypothetical protein A9P82_00320 [Arachidicoccus sp. BS20]